MRRFLHDLTLLAAVTAAGGYALGRISTEPARRAAFTMAPLVADRPAMPWDDAMDVLRTAPRFASASVGFGGVVPHAVVAWLTVLSQSSADSLFLDLLGMATPAGRMYALAGLRAIDPAEFERRASPFRRDANPVNTLMGCIGSTMTTAQIVSELDRGMWLADFMTASRARYFGDLPWPEP